MQEPAETDRTLVDGADAGGFVTLGLVPRVSGRMEIPACAGMTGAGNWGAGPERPWGIGPLSPAHAARRNRAPD